MTGGECRLVSTPQYQVKGKTPYDQRWISGTTEALVRGCNQPRPKPRLPSMDPVPKKAAVPLPPVKQIKKRWYDKFKTS